MQWLNYHSPYISQQDSHILFTDLEDMFSGNGWMDVCFWGVCVLTISSVCLLLSRSQFFWLSWREFVCEGISLCPPVFMHDSSSFSKVPYGGRSKRPGWQIKLTTSSHTRPTFLSFFFFSQRWGLEGDNIGRVNIQFTTQPSRQKWGGKLLSRIFLMHSLHNSDIWKKKKKKEENRLGILPVCVFSIWKIISLPHCHMATAVQRDDRYKYMNA